MHILNVKMSDGFHKRFKLACVHEGKEMSKLVRAWIERYIGKVEKKHKLKR